MTTIGVSMVRDEEDIVRAVVENMLRQTDGVVIADNLSTDRTREILDEMALVDDRVVVVADNDPAYTQSAKMTDLAHRARAMFGAEWIVPFDADEVWYSRFGKISEVLANVPPNHHVVPATLFDHVATGIDDPDVADPTERIQWRRDAPGVLPKIAARYRPDLVIEQGNHGAHYAEFVPASFERLLTIRHFPYRSVEQLVRKVRNGADAYRAAGDRLSPDHGAHWRQWGDLLDSQGPGAIEALFREWYWRAAPRRPMMIGGERQPPLRLDPVWVTVGR